jgi:GDPmannose 4,6-dehydratase
MDQKVAVITGIGMDSKTLTHLLLSKGYKVILTFRRNTSQNLDSLLDFFTEDLVHFPQSKLQTLFMDITDSTSVRTGIEAILTENGRIDEFYNLAAQSHVGDSFKNPLYTVVTNGIGVFHILDTLHKLSPKTRFYQASTSEMFGGDPTRIPFNEATPFECRSPYAIGKMLGYNWVSYFRQTYGMFACSGFLFNHSNVYRHKTFFIRKVTNSAAKIALGKQKELILGNLDHWRDEHWSDFGCEAMWKMLNMETPDDYVIANGYAHHGEEYLDLAFGYFNINWKDYVKFDPSYIRPNEVVKLVGNCDKAKSKLGWTPGRLPFDKHIHFMCQYDFELEAGQKPKRPVVL